MWTGRRGYRSIQPCGGLLKMGEGKGRLAFQQVHHGDRGLFLGARWTVGLKAVPVFVTDRELLGKLLGEIEWGHGFG